MFRVQFVTEGQQYGFPDFKPIIRNIDPNARIEGNIAYIEDDTLKAAFKATGYCGRGIAILGMKPFDPETNVLTFVFDSAEDAAEFKSWMCHAGEQMFWDSDYAENPIMFQYNDPGGDTIIATRKN